MSISLIGALISNSNFTRKKSKDKNIDKKCIEPHCYLRRFEQKKRCKDCFKNNIELQKAKRREYSKGHRYDAEKKRQYDKQWRKRPYVKNTIKFSNEKRMSTAKGRLNLLKGQAKRRGLSVEIELDWYTKFLNQPCYYCGNSLPKYGSGMDRVDNKKGYSIDNVIPSCSDCNKGRADRYKVQEWKIMTKALIDYRNSQ